MATPITAALIKELRDETGAGMMECKKALEASDGDKEKAKAWLRDRGVALAAKKEGRAAEKGMVGSYIHHSGTVGVLLELNCETDFVARTEDFQKLHQELCFQIAAMKPRWVSRDQVPADILDSKKKEFEAEAIEQKKPAAIAAKIAEGKLDSWLADFCLLDQAYARETSGKVKIRDLVTEAVAKMGENILVRRFVRFEVGKD